MRTDSFSKFTIAIRRYLFPVELTVEVESSALASLEMEIQQVLGDLDLGGKVIVERGRH